MFTLTPDQLEGSVLDCPSGSSSFAAELRGICDVTSVDPIYSGDLHEVSDISLAELERGMAYFRANPHLIDKSYIGSLDLYEGSLRRARERFLLDFRENPSRYICGSLPHLPLEDESFDLVLSSHLLFVYPDHFDYAGHLSAVKEMMRVTRGELRIHPFVSTAGEPWPLLGRLRSELESQGHYTEVAASEYQFVRGGGSTLIVKRA
ncbi:methyltransferase domain-containing protein [Streptomyces sp. NPDC015127]|uniref:methyltransferase domain-containing protein n=1 Tax=Streptomyces sp. NPDC015127 TaxID=3364939 RepID=UPI0036F9D73B